MDAQIGAAIVRSGEEINHQDLEWQSHNQREAVYGHVHVHVNDHGCVHGNEKQFQKSSDG